MRKFKVDWILVDEIAIGKAPKRKEDFDLLLSNGFKSILSLCYQDEYEFDREFLKPFNYLNYPIPDHRKGKLPTTLEISEALNLLDLAREKGPVFIHCFAAVERSPLICMAWLINKKKMNTNEALEYMMEVHPRTCPLSSQLKLLNDDLITNN